MYAIGVLVNYFTAQVFLALTHYQSDIHANRLSLSYCNTRWGMIIAIIGIGIKLSKDWYLQQAENTYMLKRKNRAEIQLRKSRIQPELLLRTLDNIHLSVSNSFKNSGEMILTLSDVLSYSLYDSDNELVPVEKEIEGVKNLIALEQLGAGTRGSLHISNAGELHDTYIVPMTLIKLLEECITLVHRHHIAGYDIETGITARQGYICMSVTVRSHNETTLRKKDWNTIIESLQKRMQEHYTPGDFTIDRMHEQNETIVQLEVKMILKEDMPQKSVRSVYEDA